MTTPDAEAERRLYQALENRHGDFEAWERLGRLLKFRRQRMGYHNRRQFVRDRGKPCGLNEKFVYDIEGGPRWGRLGFGAEKMLAVGAAYAVTVRSLAEALEDGGELVPLPEAEDQPPAPPPPAVPPPAVPLGGRYPATPAMQAAMAPYLVKLGVRLGEVRRSPQDTPSGEEMFAGAPAFAADRDDLVILWDMFIAGRTAEETAELCAAFMVHKAERRAGSQGAAAGLIPVHGP